MPGKNKNKDRIIYVGYYSEDILNHSVLQCLSSLRLKMYNDSEFTIFSVREFQSSMILLIYVCKYDILLIEYMCYRYYHETQI